MFEQRLAERLTAADSELDEADSRQLIAGIPQAVAQLGTLLVGPFGILTSSESRSLYPSLQTGPVPCLDPGCAALHTVRLSGVTASAHEAEGILEGLASGGVAWRRKHEYAVGEDARYLDDLHPGSLPITLANAFSLQELQGLLAEVVDNHPQAIRPWVREHRNLRQSFAQAGRACRRVSSLEGCCNAFFSPRTKSSLRLSRPALTAVTWRSLQRRRGISSTRRDI